MASPKSVSQIKSGLLRPALSSHFEVQIPVPTNLRGILGTNQEKLNLMCSEASLPGSSLATSEISNSYHGVTERHAYRRIYDDRIDLTFYVDAENYTPIRFFENWISYIVGETDRNEMKNTNYSYRSQYPDEYIANQGLKVIKFERDYGRSLQYEFIRAYPLAITSMPVSYEGSNLMTCNVSMTYIRYIASPIHTTGVNVPTPTQQAGFNIGGFLTNAAANLVDSAVTTVTGSDTAGDIAGTVAGVAAANALGIAVVTGTDGVLRNAATGEPI
tara:strand:- start:973 stop:1791 length:819 start_codon:yes stop_codon:yes gene_type:complete